MFSCADVQYLTLRAHDIWRYKLGISDNTRLEIVDGPRISDHTCIWQFFAYLMVQHYAYFMWSELEISYVTANCLHHQNCHGNLHCLHCSHSFCSTAGDSTQLGVSDDKIMKCLVVWKCDIWWYETCNIWQYVVQQTMRISWSELEISYDGTANCLHHQNCHDNLHS